MPVVSYPRVASFRTARAAAEHLQALGYSLPADDEILPAPASPLAQWMELPGLGEKAANRAVGNRFAAQPMEGWDCETDGRPSEHTKRRWQRFGQSGAKLIWGGEACAVRPDGRANPRQLTMAEHTQTGIAALRDILIKAHVESGDRNNVCNRGAIRD